MKKILGIVSIFLTLIITASVCVSANSVGNVIGNTLYTDIVAYINDYAIESYNIDGYTAVVAEDLINYGFTVKWNADERALNIERSKRNNIDTQYIAPTIPKKQVGKKAHSVLSTDIKTYISGNLVTSYNIGGKTIIYFDDLNVFGDIKYDDSSRILELDISDGLQYKLGDPLDNALYFTRNSVNGLSFYINAMNNTNKTIKYFHVEFLMMNSVFDLSYDMYKNCSYKMNIVGPMYPGNRIANAGPERGVDTYNDDVCYYVGVSSVFVEYMDGTSETIPYVDLGVEQEEDNGYHF